MPIKRYALEKNGPKRLVISWAGAFENLAIQLDDKNIATIRSRQELRTAQEYQLPDGSLLRIQLEWLELHLLRNGKPIPGSASDPAERLKGAAFGFFWVAGVSLIYSIVFLLGGHWGGSGIELAITQFVDNTSIRTATNDGRVMDPQILAIAKIIAFAVDIGIIGIFVILGVLARKTQKWGFIIAGMILYALDGIIFLLYGIFFSAFMHLVILIFFYRGLRAGRKQITAA